MNEFYSSFPAIPEQISFYNKEYIIYAMNLAMQCPQKISKQKY